MLNGTSLVTTQVQQYNITETCQLWTSNADGSKVRLWYNGSIQDTSTGEWISVIIQDYTLVGAATIVTPGFSVLITDSRTGTVYIVYPDGNVYDYIKGSIVTVGGINGLITYIERTNTGG